MASYNKLTIIGNVVRDPEIRYVDGGQKSVTKWSLAVNRKSKLGDEVMFIDVIAWDRLSEICNQYLKKGMSILVEGRLVIREYTNKVGEKRKAIEVVANEMQMLDTKGHATGEASAPTSAPSTSSQRTPATVGGGGRAAEKFDDNDDFGEIPFAVDPLEDQRASASL